MAGVIELWSGDAAAAAEWFAAAEETADAAEWNEPNLRWWRADYVEALLELGRTADAVVVLDAWEADAVRVDRAWVLAQVTRCRGLVAAARGDVERGLRLLGRRSREHEQVGDPFGRARALLALGVLRRRARQKRAAREAIEAALAGLRGARGGRLGGEGARRARAHRRAHPRGGSDAGRTAASPCSSRRDGRTARSPRPCSSASARWRAT